jgi:hypothetical protein
MSPQVEAAIIGASAAIFVLVVKDLGFQLYLDYKKRQREIEDRNMDELHVRRDLFWQYAAPLFRSIEDLHYRLAEINRGPAIYLLPTAPANDYNEYKKISTSYRLASFLGWIRAYRKERSYIDAAKTDASERIEKLIVKIEKQLADGQGIEKQRLDALMTHWRITQSLPSDEILTAVAAELDAAIDKHLSLGLVVCITDLRIYVKSRPYKVGVFLPTIGT